MTEPHDPPRSDNRHPVKCTCGWSGRRQLSDVAKPCPECDRPVAAVPRRGPKVKITSLVYRADLDVLAPGADPAEWRLAIREAVAFAAAARTTAPVEASGSAEINEIEVG